MGDRRQLPPPRLVETPRICPGCAYSLEGAERLDRCPECGARIDLAAPAIQIACVPKRERGPVWRRFAWAGIFVGGILFFQFGFTIALAVPRSWPIMMLILAAIVAGAVLMLRTGSSTKTGTERVTFTSSGILRAPFGATDSRGAHAWAGVYHVRARPIGKVWQGLSISRRLDNGDTTEMFDCGFRCPDVALEAVRCGIHDLAHGRQPGPDVIEILGEGEERASVREPA